jgi:hypothetical protein
MFPLRPLGSTRVSRFIATTGRSDSRTGAPGNYVFSPRAGLPLFPASLCGSLMFLKELSDRAVLFDPGEPEVCI